MDGENGYENFQECLNNKMIPFEKNEFIYLNNDNFNNAVNLETSL
jgi:hypothetical protein